MSRVGSLLHGTFAVFAFAVQNSLVWLACLLLAVPPAAWAAPRECRCAADCPRACSKGTQHLRSADGSVAADSGGNCCPQRSCCGSPVAIAEVSCPSCQKGLASLLADPEAGSCPCRFFPQNEPLREATRATAGHHVSSVDSVAMTAPRAAEVSRDSHRRWSFGGRPVSSGHSLQSLLCVWRK